MRWNHIEESYFTSNLTDLDLRTQNILKQNGITHWQDIPTNLDELKIPINSRRAKRFLSIWLMRCNGFCAIYILRRAFANHYNGLAGRGPPPRNPLFLLQNKNDNPLIYNETIFTLPLDFYPCNAYIYTIINNIRNK